MALKNLRIGSRLGIGFATILVMSLAGTASALYTARTSAEATTNMMQQPLAKERLVADWMMTTNVAVARTSMIARTSDTTLAGMFAKPMAEAVARTTETLKKIEPLLATAQEKELFARVIALRKAYQDAKVAVTNARKAGDSAGAEQAYSDRFEPAAKVYQATVLDLLDAQRSLFDAQRASVEANLARLQNQVTLYRVLGGGWTIPATATTAANAATTTNPSRQ